jgi:hypothetical protein
LGQVVALTRLGQSGPSTTVKLPPLPDGEVAGVVKRCPQQSQILGDLAEAKRQRTEEEWYRQPNAHGEILLSRTTETQGIWQTPLIECSRQWVGLAG